MTPYPTQKQKKSRGRWVIIVAILAGLSYGAYRVVSPSAGGAPAQTAQALPTPVAGVISKPVTVWSEFSGKIEAVESAEIRPRVGGQITAIHFKDGQTVKRGQPLFTIDTRSYEAELSRARGAVISATSAQKNAAQDFARAQQLVKTKAISTAEFERAQSMFQQANGALETAKGGVKAAQTNLDYAHISAPISGQISRAELTVGNNVEAGSNAPLMASIVDLSPIYASFELDEKTYFGIAAGKSAAALKLTPVEVQPGSDASVPAIKAALHAFDNQIASGSGTIRARAVIENKDKSLLPGMFAKVRIGTADSAASILINPVAIGTDQNKKFVLVVNAEQKAEYREVVLGGITEGLQVIKSGLKDGEQIVVGGLQRLRPGAPVQPIPSDMLTLKPLAEEVPQSTAETAAH